MGVSEGLINNMTSLLRGSEYDVGVPGVGGHLITSFATLELTATIKLLKGGKAQGSDNIPPKFRMHCGKMC